MEVLILRSISRGVGLKNILWKSSSERDLRAVGCLGAPPTLSPIATGTDKIPRSKDEGPDPLPLPGLVP